MAPVRPEQASAPREAVKVQRLFPKSIYSVFLLFFFITFRPRFRSPAFLSALSFPSHKRNAQPPVDHHLALDVARDGIHWLKLAAAGKPLVFLLLVEGLLPLEGYDVIDVSNTQKQSGSRSLRSLAGYVPRNFYDRSRVVL